MDKTPVFHDLKVLDFSTSVVGPSAARLLADYGATVIKVESLIHLDGLRTSPPYMNKESGVNRSGYFNNYNGGKLSFSLNMRIPKAIDIAKRLVRWADVLIEGFRPGVMAKFGLDYESCKAQKADLIMVSTTMLGQSGPFSAYRGYGQHGSAVAGWGSLIGYAHGEEVPPFGAYTDYIGARYVAIAVMAALEYRESTGEGVHIDNSQVECSLDYMTPLIIDYSIHNKVPGKAGNRDPFAAPHGVYRCQNESEWCAIAVESDEQWQSFCECIGQSSLATDSRYRTLKDRKANEDELDMLVQSWTQKMPVQDVVTLLQENRIAAAAVANARDLMNDPQLKHRGHFHLLEHSEIGAHHYEDFGFRLSKTPGGPQAAAPCLGEHNDNICSKILALSDEELIELISEGVLE